jgi:hypothetical protein
VIMVAAAVPAAAASAGTPTVVLAAVSAGQNNIDLFAQARDGAGVGGRFRLVVEFRLDWGTRAWDEQITAFSGSDGTWTQRVLRPQRDDYTYDAIRVRVEIDSGTYWSNEVGLPPI